MKKIGIFYGSSTGTTETIAGQIAMCLGVDAVDVHNVGNTSIQTAGEYEVLVLGSSTWGAGELQDDWYDFLSELENSSLNGKKIALFGCGDAISFGSTFCDAVGIIYEKLQGKGCSFIGSIHSSGYSYDASAAETDGRLVGLLIDDNNEPGKTESRIKNWTEQLKQEI